MLRRVICLCRKYFFVMILFIFVLRYSIESYANEIGVEVSSVSDSDAISVELPIVENDGYSPFDFIMDPQGLITATNAARYGGKNFEKGATLYFRNTKGDFDFSQNSDRLTVTNNSENVIRVTVKASIENLGSVVLTSDNSFEEDKRSSIYLAVVDNRGNEVTFSSDGEACITVIIDAYAVDNYEFGLRGSCNANGDWGSVNEDVKPQVTVVWAVEPICSEVVACGVDLDEVLECKEVFSQEAQTVSSGDAITVSGGDINAL